MAHCLTSNLTSKTLRLFGLAALVGFAPLPPVFVMAQSLEADSGSRPSATSTAAETDEASSLRRTRITRKDQATDSTAETETNSDDTENSDAVPDPDTATTEPPSAADEDAALDPPTRENLPEQTVDGLKLRPASKEDETPGIAVGTFTFRPSLTETLGTERERTGKTKTSRTYIESRIKGTLSSNWSRHALKVETDGLWQKTLSGQTKDDPEGSIKATLDLDIGDSTAAELRAGYSIGREDVTAANAISNATNQAEVEQYTLGGDITRDLGLIRTTAGLDFSRSVYGPAILQNNKTLSQSDRDENTATLRGRIGYELSPSLIPFIEASAGKTLYDQRADSLGYRRDATTYALKGGLAADFGDKLRGEISTGYAVATFADRRLADIAAWTIDSKANWSPHRGTDLEFGLKTEIEPSTTAGASGSVAYTANMALTQAILDELSGRLTLAETVRDYSLAGTNNQYVFAVGTGLTWEVSRSLDINADVSWQNTRQKGADTSDSYIAGIGLTLKR